MGWKAYSQDVEESFNVLLYRIEVIADDEEEIVEAARRLTSHYDLVVTSGGIGPTHDDITYESLARAFDPEEGKLEYDDETLERMYELSKRRFNFKDQTEEQQTARKRMALFPVKHAEVLHVDPALWVPVVRMKQRLCILPGVPKLFEQLLTCYLANYVELPVRAANAILERSLAEIHFSNCSAKFI